MTETKQYNRKPSETLNYEYTLFKKKGHSTWRIDGQPIAKFMQIAIDNKVEIEGMKLLQINRLTGEVKVIEK